MVTPHALVAALTLFLGLPSTPSPSPRLDDALPTLRVDEPTFDWGQLVRGQEARHTFVLHNDGTADLNIEHVLTSCGCTAAEFPERIAPGAHAEITVELATENLAPRRVHKTATVVSDDPEQPALQLVLCGTLLPVVEVAPRDVELVGHYSEAKRATVILTPGVGRTLEVLSARSLTGRVEVAEIRATGPEGRHELDLVAAPVEGAQELRDVLRVEVIGGDGIRREARIPVRVHHRARVYADASALVFRHSAPGRTVGDGEIIASQSISVSAFGDDTLFQVTGVELDGLEGRFRASVEPIEAGRRYWIVVDCLGKDEATHAQGTLVIRTDEPDVERLEVRVFAQIGRGRAPRVARR